LWSVTPEADYVNANAGAHTRTICDADASANPHSLEGLDADAHIVANPLPHAIAHRNDNAVAHAVPYIGAAIEGTHDAALEGTNIDSFTLALAISHCGHDTRDSGTLASANCRSNDQSHGTAQQSSHLQSFKCAYHEPNVSCNAFSFGRTHRVANSSTFRRTNENTFRRTNENAHVSDTTTFEGSNGSTYQDALIWTHLGALSRAHT
jgi:hypothetical protein